MSTMPHDSLGLYSFLLPKILVIF